MKKLNSINWVSFKENGLYLEDISIDIGLNIDEWLTNSNNIEIELEIAKYDANREYFEFINYPNISISIYDKIIKSINIYPYQFQSSPYFKGDIFIFDKKLEVPFKSVDIENYFPDINIKPKGYFKRFTPRETVDYPISDTVKIEISMGRDPELVSSLSLKAI